MPGKVRADHLHLVPAKGAAAGREHAVGGKFRRVDSAIDLDNVTLRYPLHPVGQGSIKSLVMGLFGHREPAPRREYVQALSGVSLQIRNGERVGIVGRNGSGKSSFLKALAGVYPLASGRIKIAGRIGALLDLGVGFEAESTGRENIYTRGAAMGYSPRQLRMVEQDIIDFADLGDFIDLPVRTYSAGMNVRLGFAISTQMDPDVLLIDEIFGAGDAGFAQRAVARMMDMVERSAIMVIATHDMVLIKQVCTRVLWISQGQVVADGPPDLVIHSFLDHIGGGAS